MPNSERSPESEDRSPSPATPDRFRGFVIRHSPEREAFPSSQRVRVGKDVVRDSATYLTPVRCERGRIRAPPSFVIRQSRWHWHCLRPKYRVKYLIWKKPIRRFMRFNHYDVGNFFDEAFSGDCQPRSAAEALVRTIESLPDGELLSRQQAAERALLQMGITFNVHGEQAGVEKIFPFDLGPGFVSAGEWGRMRSV